MRLIIVPWSTTLVGVLVVVVGLSFVIVVDGGGSSSSSTRTIFTSSHNNNHHLPSLNFNSTSSKSKTSTPLDEEEDYDYKEEEDDDLDDDEDYDSHSLHHHHLHTAVADNNAKGVDNDWSTTTCPTPLHGHCHCGRQRDPRDKSRLRSVVNCTHAGFTSTDFFFHVPTDTEALIVVGNELHSLPQNLFGVGPGRDMIALKELDLRQNDIQSIHGKTFHRVPNLETLILSFNKLSPAILLDHPRLFVNLPSLKFLHLTGSFTSSSTQDQYLLLNGLYQAFEDSKLTNLLKLHLEQNHISRIPNRRQFCDLPSLLDLHLGQNELTDLVLEVEDCSPSLRFVDLSYNRITGVGGSSGIFSLLNHLNQRSELVRVELYHNPFICDCSLDTFLDWMKNMTLKDPDIFRHRPDMRCGSGYPESNAKKMLQYVDKTDCPPPTLVSTNTVIDRLSWSVVSLIGLSALMALLVLWLKTRGGNDGGNGGCGFLRLITPNSTGHPLLSTTTSGVKYVSVDKEEVAEVAHV